MAITSLGVGSGLDAEGIVTKLVALERQPISQLQTAASKLQTKISAYGQIKSNISALRDAAQKLTSPDLWSSAVANSSDSAAVNFSTGSGASPGSYSVSVSKLASTQAVVSKATLTSSASTLGSGTLTIQLGSWSGSTFSPQAGSTATPVTIDASDSLEAIRDKINAAGSGVSASIINDASGSRLVMNSSATGASNGFRIQVTDDDGGDGDDSGLSALAYDPGTGTTGTTLTQSAANASATLNGIAVSSSTNTFTDVLTGISMTVGKVTADPVNVSVTQDNETIKKSINDFASAYSTLVTYLKDNTKYDEATKKGGTLQGDSLAVGALNQFRSAMGSGTTASSVFSTLSSVGLEIQANGTLTVNASKLSSALGNLKEVKKLFSTASTAGSGTEGIATRIRVLSDQALSFDGSLSTRTDGLNKSVSNNQKRQDELSARAAMYEKRLRAQYTALDTSMASLSAQGGYVSQMIAGLNKS